MDCTNLSHKSVRFVWSPCHLPAPHGLGIASAAYLDDIIIQSDTWAQNMQHVAAVLESLKQVVLTALPNKCAVGWRDVEYLGYHLGGGQVCPQVEKKTTIASSRVPGLKKEMRRIYGAG